MNELETLKAQLADVTKERDLLAESLNAHRYDAIRVVQLEKLNREMVTGLNDALGLLQKLEAMK